MLVFERWRSLFEKGIAYKTSSGKAQMTFMKFSRNFQSFCYYAFSNQSIYSLNVCFWRAKLIFRNPSNVGFDFPTPKSFRHWGIWRIFQVAYLIIYFQEWFRFMFCIFSPMNIILTYWGYFWGGRISNFLFPGAITCTFEIPYQRLAVSELGRNLIKISMPSVTIWMHTPTSHPPTSLPVSNA